MTSIFPQGIRGLSDSKWSGIPGSAYRLVGIDLHSTPGLTKVHQKLTKNSGETVDELCKQRIQLASGSTLWFSAESGKVWRETSGTWTLVHTTVPTSGEAKCLGAAEFEDWVYWATESYMHRIHVDDVDEDDWSGFLYDNFASFTVGDDEFHPMVEQNLDLFIGDKTLITKITAPATADADPTGTLTTTLGSSVDWAAFGCLLNPSESAFPALLESVRATQPTDSPNTYSMTVHVVAGGGGGGAAEGGNEGGGGGGGGGVREESLSTVTPGAIAVTVGAGGAGASTDNANGGDGAASSFGSFLSSVGGGGGGNGNGDNGRTGGSGGGAGTGGDGGAGTVGQGNDGGNGGTTSGGGGGGANAVGNNASSGTGGSGGAGVSTSISGSSVTYGGGGGGGGSSSGGSGGSGGGGAGSAGASGTAGTANTGGGGGGGGSTGTLRSGGDGGSGKVTVSYPTGTVLATGGTITTSGGNTIHTFTSSGTFTISETTLTKSITIPAGHNKELVVFVANYDSTTVSAVTFDGDALTEVTSGTATPGSTTIRRSIFRLDNPEAKTGDIVVTWSSAISSGLFHAMVFDGVNQTTPIAAFGSGNGTSTSAAFTLTSSADYQLRLAMVVSKTATHTLAAGQTSIQGSTNAVGRDSSSYIGTTVAHTLTDTDFNIKTPERIQAMIALDIDILVGTKRVNIGRVLRWDTASESWGAEDIVEENGINAFIRDDNYVYAQAGDFGRLYFYDGEKLVPYQRIPGDWSPSKTAKIHPNAVAFLLGVPVFGISNVAGNPVLQGVYSFGSYSKDYTKVLDLSFPISSGNFSGVTIGAILVNGADMYVAWKDASGAGVDKLDYTAKYASAYIETMMLTPLSERGALKTLSNVAADYVSLPANTDITTSYQKKHEGSYTPLTTVDDTKLNQVRTNQQGTVPEVAALQLRFDFTVSSNDSPEVENFDYKMQEMQQ